MVQIMLKNDGGDRDHQIHHHRSMIINHWSLLVQFMLKQECVDLYDGADLDDNDVYTMVLI